MLASDDGQRRQATGWKRRLAAVTAVTLLVFVVPVPTRAHDTLVGDDGVTRPGTYAADVVPSWKTRLLILHDKVRRGAMLAADIAEWNAIIDAHGLDRKARIMASAAKSRITGSGEAPDGSTSTTATSFDLPGTQKPQTTTYYCGPASAQSIVLAWHNVNATVYPTASSFDGATLTQAHLATSRYTNADAGSTDWVDHDMQRALNNWIFNGGVTYVQYTPTSAATLEDHVTTDMSVSMEIASDMSEAAGNGHYNYHPGNLTIYHWTTIRGYASSGATLHFQDPAANTTVLSSAWANVQPYFSQSSSITYGFMTRNATRGIVW